MSFELCNRIEHVEIRMGIGDNLKFGRLIIDKQKNLPSASVVAMILMSSNYRSCLQS